MAAPPWSWRSALLVAAGAVPGALLRWYLGTWWTRGDFPWGTTLVNVTGSFAIGLLMFGAVERGYLGPDARLALVVGFLGAYTTMSSFAYETVAYLGSGEYLKATAYIFANPFACILGALVGRSLGALLPAV
ncbi:MAG: fluoride efflux transporter CrcB [Thermoplasmatota archaeon]